MLRFSSNDIAVKPDLHKASRRLRVRLWLLVLMLGLVLIAMRRMQQPQTAQKLGQLFSAQNYQLVNSPDNQTLNLNTARGILAAPGDSRGNNGVEQLGGQSPRLAPGAREDDLQVDSDSLDLQTVLLKPIDEKLLNDIEDNTSFQPKEQAAWFALFGRLQHISAHELSGQSMGTLAYAQLLQQPDTYRGRVVTLRGTVLREEIQHAPENAIGIETYHRLWLQPAGGGQWPFVIYCLQLPEQFPRGDSLRAAVEVSGYFFKNWSYAWDDDFGLAPIVLSAGVEWKRPAPVQKNELAKANWKALTLAVVVAAVFALVVLFFTWKHTQPRPQGSASQFDDTSIREAMRQVSESE